MKMVILGTGNVATVLGRRLRAAGHQILQVFGRNTATASELAYELDTESCNYWSLVRQDADVYLFALTDSVIAEAHRELKLTNQLAIHTAGSVSIEVLKNISSSYGVLYPLQSLRKEMPVYTEIPLLYDGNNESSRSLIQRLAMTISPTVSLMGDAQRLKLHLAAVVVNNFTNHLYSLAEDYCKRNGLPFSQLQPLIRETAERVSYTSPVNVQTGPAVRGDVTTIQRHLELLAGDDHLRQIYAQMTESIEQFQLRTRTER